MDTWTLQKGYPVINIDTKCYYCNNSYDDDDDNNENDYYYINITQNWFLLNPNNNNQTTTDYKWYIPFTYTTSNELNFNFETKPIWFKKNDTSIQIKINNNNNSNETWLIGNIKHSGYYRVNYDENNWNLLINQLLNDHTKIDIINRAQLIDDSFNLGRAGLIDQTLFLKITSYLVNETDPLAFQTAFIGLNYIADMLSHDDDIFKMFKVSHFCSVIISLIANLIYFFIKNFYSALFSNIYQKFKWNQNLTDVNEMFVSFLL